VAIVYGVEGSTEDADAHADLTLCIVSWLVNDGVEG